MKFVRVLFAYLVLCSGTFAQVGQIPSWPPVQPVIASGCVASFVLDGSNTINNNGSGVTTTIPLTTVNGCGVIIVGGISNVAVSTVTAPGLTFTLRAAVNASGNFVYEYSAPYTTNFSGNISVTTVSNTFNTISAFGISGASAASPFDGTAQSSTTVIPPITTTHANTFIISIILSTGTATQGAGWTLINGANFQAAEYQIFATTQSGLTPTYASGASVPAITDAVVKGP